MLNNYLIENIHIESEKVKNLVVNDFTELYKTPFTKFTKDFIRYKIEHDGFSFNDLNSLIEDAVKLRFNYTIRPVWTLKKFLFGKLDSIPANQLKEKLKLLKFYNYYTDTISQYIDDSGDVIITSYQIEEVLHHTNIIVYEKLKEDISTERIRNFLLQLFKLKYISENEVNLHSEIDFNIIKTFIGDKEFYELFQKLTEYEQHFTGNEISLKDIIKIFTDKFNYIESPVTLKEEEKKEDEVVTPIAEESEIIVNFESDIKHFDENIDAAAYAKHEIPAIELQEDLINIELPTEVINESSLAEERKKVKRLFKKDELEAINKKVFKFNRQEMSDTFEELEKLPSWDDAVEHLKNLFVKNKVDMYDVKVILFVDLIEGYFKNKEEKI
ncbi:MAG TPA: hypothetical protein VHP32_03540 [Ignavibacteria bacterium]|nr:hypothetical protein [Ignavibacteria bacterium]